MKLQDYLRPDENNRTPLYWAACNGELYRAMKALRTSKEKLSLKHFLIEDCEGKTPLMRALENGHLNQVMKVLRASKEKLTLQHFLIPDYAEKNCVHWAARDGQLDSIKKILQASGEKLSMEHFLIQSNNGFTPLHRATASGHLKQIFDPPYWQGRVGEMMQLWGHVPEEKRKTAGFDFQEIVKEAIQIGVQTTLKIDAGTFSQATRACASSATRAEIKTTGAVPLAR